MKKEKENITDIEELIADAKAEEEVAAEQAKAAREKAREDFRETLRENLKEAFTPSYEDKVSVKLAEYTLLKQKELDLDRLLNAIADSFRLSYNKEYLMLNDDRVVETFRALYPDMYDSFLAAELDNVENSEENEG